MEVLRISEVSELCQSTVHSYLWLVLHCRYLLKFEKFVPHKMFPRVDAALRGASGPVEGTPFVLRLSFTSTELIHSRVLRLWFESVEEVDRGMRKNWYPSCTRCQYYCGYSWRNEGKSALVYAAMPNH